MSINLEKAKNLFPAVAGSMESPEGSIHMLGGMDHMKDATKEQARLVLVHGSEEGFRS